MTRLEIYDVLRQMHRLLKDVDEREDEWEQNVLDTVAGTLYMAESEFTKESSQPPSPPPKWSDIHAPR